MYGKITLALVGILVPLVGFFLFPVAQSNFAYYAWQKNVVSEPLEQEFCKSSVSSETILCIPKLHISTPVTQEAELKNIQPLLKNGITHLLGSGTPGEFGNAVYFGHSSDYFWEKGPAKTIFSTLNRLQMGDSIYFLNTSKTFQYKVSRVSEISPRTLSVVANDENKKTVTLITCWPPGTTLKRLVVIAELQE